MPDEKPVQDTLTPEQKSYLDGEIVKAREAAATATKTELEEARKKAIPDTYELKFADGSPLDPKQDAEKIAAYLKAHGFTAEQAKAHLVHLDEVARGLKARQQATLTDLREQWEADVRADKELGGEKYSVTEQHLKRAMDRFAPQGSPFRELLNESGYGSHPEFVRFVVKIGRAMAEDRTILGGGDPPRAKKTDAEVFYGKNQTTS